MFLIINPRNLRAISQNFPQRLIFETQVQKQKLSTSSLKCFPAKESGTHKPNTIDKYLLVWMKKYPSVKDVPKTVSVETMSKVKDWSRIRLNIIFCFFTAFACIVMVYSGKKAASRGESLSKINKQWHDDQNAKTN